MNYENNKENFKAAVQHVEKAVSILQKIRNTSNRKTHSDLIYFEYQLKEILSSDHGECGMVPAVKTLF